MAYTATYVATDLTPITFDLVGNLLAALAGQMGVIAQLFVLLLIIGAISAVIGAVMGFFAIFSQKGR